MACWFSSDPGIISTWSIGFASSSNSFTFGFFVIETANLVCSFWPVAWILVLVARKALRPRSDKLFEWGTFSRVSLLVVGYSLLDIGSESSSFISVGPDSVNSLVYGSCSSSWCWSCLFFVLVSVPVSFVCSFCPVCWILNLVAWRASSPRPAKLLGWPCPWTSTSLTFSVSSWIWIGSSLVIGCSSLEIGLETPSSFSIGPDSVVLGFGSCSSSCCWPCLFFVFVSVPVSFVCSFSPVCWILNLVAWRASSPRPAKLLRWSWPWTSVSRISSVSPWCWRPCSVWSCGDVCPSCSVLFFAKVSVNFSCSFWPVDWILVFVACRAFNPRPARPIAGSSLLPFSTDSVCWSSVTPSVIARPCGSTISSSSISDFSGTFLFLFSVSVNLVCKTWPVWWIFDLVVSSAFSPRSAKVTCLATTSGSTDTSEGSTGSWSITISSLSSSGFFFFLDRVSVSLFCNFFPVLLSLFSVETPAVAAVSFSTVSCCSSTSDWSPGAVDDARVEVGVFSELVGRARLLKSSHPCWILRRIGLRLSARFTSTLLSWLRARLKLTRLSTTPRVFHVSHSCWILRWMGFRLCARLTSTLFSRLRPRFRLNRLSTTSRVFQASSSCWILRRIGLRLSVRFTSPPFSRLRPRCKRKSLLWNLDSTTTLVFHASSSFWIRRRIGPRLSLLLRLTSSLLASFSVDAWSRLRLRLRLRRSFNENFFSTTRLVFHFSMRCSHSSLIFSRMELELPARLLLLRLVSSSSPTSMSSSSGFEPFERLRKRREDADFDVLW